MTGTSGTASASFGRGFFLANSVLYDLEQGQIGVTTAVVQAGVPDVDPAGCGSAAVLIAAAFGLFERRRLKAITA
jgi:hypothetical protein